MNYTFLLVVAFALYYTAIAAMVFDVCDGYREHTAIAFIIAIFWPVLFLVLIPIAYYFGLFDSLRKKK